MSVVACETAARTTSPSHNRRRWHARLWWILPAVIIAGWFEPLVGLVIPICERVCPLSIAPHALRGQGVVGDWDCLKCNLCVTHCPRNCLSITDTEVARAA